MRLKPQRYDELEELAADFIDAHGVTSYPIDPTYLLERMRVPVISYRDITDDEARKLAVAASRDAFHVTDDKHQCTKTRVFYDPLIEGLRIKTSVCHELAHIICGHLSDEEPYESEAKYLASYLLAPTPLVIMRKLHTWQEVADVFVTTRQTAEIRLERAQTRMRVRKPWAKHEKLILECCGQWIEESYATLSSRMAGYDGPAPEFIDPGASAGKELW